MRPTLAPMKDQMVLDKVPKFRPRRKPRLRVLGVDACGTRYVVPFSIEFAVGREYKKIVEIFKRWDDIPAWLRDGSSDDAVCTSMPGVGWLAIYSPRDEDEWADASCLHRQARAWAKGD